MKELVKLIQNQFDVMCQTGKLFRSSITGQQVWALYLNGFAPKYNPIFRDPESSTHNCNLCNNFIRRYGNIVAIGGNGEIITMFDVKASEEYNNSMDALSQALKHAPIQDVFFETFQELNSLPYESCNKTQDKYLLGVPKNVKRYTKEEAEKFGVVKPNELRTFEHFHLSLPTQFVDKSGKSIEQITAFYRDKYQVFKRAMEEIPLDTLQLVKDLINQGSLLDGTAHLHSVKAILNEKYQYDSCTTDKYLWLRSYEIPESLAKFKNTLIGVLCTELAEGMELNKACENWNKRVDPVNYHKATAPITKKQIEEAKKFVIDNGYEESFNRRFATIDDIKVSEILHSNVGDGSVKSVSIFDNVKSTSTRHKRSEFDKVEEVSIDKFMKDILPACSSIEVYVENRMEGNMVTLTTANNPNSKPIFKWDNNYSWTFNGNLAGKSQLMQMVEAKGGRTDGVFRFTHSWNELEPNQSLMDLHVFMPGCQIPQQWHHGPHVTGRRVGWNNRKDSLSGGIQDVDYTAAAPKGYIPVENITFPNINKMPEGKYTCAINNWSFRSTGGKGKAEIAFEGNLFQYEYPRTKQDEWIIIAEVTLKDGKFSIEHKLPEINQPKEIYGLETNQFHKVNLVCLSPNHWDNNQVGNKHYMFMLDNCKTNQPIRSFHNENLIPELLTHRKVMEVLGTTNMIEPSDKQLSGLGFNSTVKDELIVRLSGTHKRVLKIKFDGISSTSKVKKEYELQNN